MEREKKEVKISSRCGLLICMKTFRAVIACTLFDNYNRYGSRGTTELGSLGSRQKRRKKKIEERARALSSSQRGRSGAPVTAEGPKP